MSSVRSVEGKWNVNTLVQKIAQLRGQKGTDALIDAYEMAIVKKWEEGKTVIMDLSVALKALEYKWNPSQCSEAERQWGRRFTHRINVKDKLTSKDLDTLSIESKKWQALTMSKEQRLLLIALQKKSIGQLTGPERMFAFAHKGLEDICKEMEGVKDEKDEPEKDPVPTEEDVKYFFECHVARVNHRQTDEQDAYYAIQLTRFPGMMKDPRFISRDRKLWATKVLLEELTGESARLAIAAVSTAAPVTSPAK